MAVVGIPQALLYHRYGKFWKSYLTELGFEVKVSAKTTKRTLESGLGKVSSEVCLPIKIIAGHIEELKDSVDYLFLPRLVWLRDQMYACPKMIGIPDLARITVPQGCKVVAPMIKGNFVVAHLRAGMELTHNPIRVWNAWLKARHLLQTRTTLPDFPAGTRKVALISHFYNLGDPYVAQDILDTLTGAGLRIYSKEDLPASVLAGQTGLANSIRWVYERELYNAFRFYSDKVDGICAIVSFGCGPDSLVTELMQQEARGLKVPFTQLVIDEHTGKAGIVTRLEAFVELVKKHRASG
jgi:predicted nucleotide-binding protein (sugar kinase/HSP70/actin superfamily)